MIDEVARRQGRTTAVRLEKAFSDIRLQDIQIRALAAKYLAVLERLEVMEYLK